MTETLLLPAPRDLPEIKVPEIPPEVAEAIERVKEALLKIADAFREIIEKIAEALAPAIKAAVEIVRNIWDAIARGLVPKKWWHLYKHAKKRRIRKKYEKRIRERVLAILSEGEA